jgi:hypothetical protein
VAGEKGGETTRDSPRLDLGAWLEEKRLPAGWTAAPDGGRRLSSCSGEPPAEEEQQAARLAPRWSREGVATHWLAGRGSDGGAPHSRGGNSWRVCG